MLRNFRLGMNCRWKSDGTPLTATDTAINKFVVKSLRRDYPHINVIGEEGSHRVRNAEYTVLFDPVDGTVPFRMGVPISTFCISVVRGHIPLCAVIHDPFGKRMWCAIRGDGSFLNHERLSVSKHRNLKRATICMVWWKSPPGNYNLHVVCERLMDAGAIWINPVSIAYFGALVASGQLEATIFPGQKGWETAPMQLMVEEAGGKVTDIYGNEMRYGEDGAIKGHIISNGRVHDELVRIVQECQR